MIWRRPDTMIGLPAESLNARSVNAPTTKLLRRPPNDRCRERSSAVFLRVDRQLWAVTT